MQGYKFHKPSTIIEVNNHLTQVSEVVLLHLLISYSDFYTHI